MNSTGCNVNVNFLRDKADDRTENLIVGAVEAVLQGENREHGDLSVILADDSMLQRYNREWLGIDLPTDVLSFDLSDREDSRVEGDIYISLDRVHVQAEEAGMEPENELIRLVVHGVLHLCGMDHKDDVSLSRMIEHGEIYVRSVFKGL